MEEVWAAWMNYLPMASPAVDEWWSASSSWLSCICLVPEANHGRGDY